MRTDIRSAYIDYKQESQSALEHVLVLLAQVKVNRDNRPKEF